MGSTDFNSASYENDLAHLAKLAGITLGYEDNERNWKKAAPQTMRALLASMGIPAETHEEIIASLKTLKEEPWRSPLPPVLALDESETQNGPVALSVHLPEDRVGSNITFVLQPENGSTIEITGTLETENITETREIDGVTIARLTVSLNLPNGTGFYSLRVKDNDDCETTLILAPDKAFLPVDMHAGKPVWGVSTMFSELISEANWGMGDIRDLEAMGDEAAAAGASLVGINPIHSLHDPRWQFCPYFPSSRIFKNPVILAIEDIPGFDECAAIQDFMEKHATELNRLRNEALVDIGAVFALKQRAMEILYQNRPPDTDFEAYCADKGDILERFALFNVLREQDRFDEFERPDSPGIEEFAAQNRNRINFFKWQQWLIDRQLERASASAKETGLKYGFYGDLAVGMDRGGADAWIFRDCVFPDAEIGAPPDALGPLGQKWGTTAFTPKGLRDRGYKPFKQMLESAMQDFGVLRLDHAMSLMRLFCIPPGRPSSEGAYVAYDLKATLGIVKLLSHRHECIVIGEDLGTVPPEFRRKMADSNVLSYRVQWFEREWDVEGQPFIEPERFPTLSLACVETHDMAPLKAYWNERDIDERRDLHLYPSGEAERAHRASRKEERKTILAALATSGLLPDGIAPDEPDASYSEELGAAIHARLFASNSLITMMSAGDMDSSIVSQNVPGVADTARPNWRAKLTRPPRELMRSQLMNLVLPALETRSNNDIEPACAPPEPPAPAP